MKLRLPLAVLLAFAFTSASIEATAIEAVTAAQDAPVYLYRDEAGRISTLDIEDKTSNGETTRSINRRDVSLDEVRDIRSHGYQVAFIDERPPQLNKQQEQAQNLGGAHTESDMLLGSLPSAFNIVEINTVIYGNIRVSGTKPSGTSTQWLAYYFQTSADFPGPSSHFASVVLFDPASDSFGNGVAIGNIGVNGGCTQFGYGYDSQIEASWTTANYLYTDTCYPDGLSPNTQYGVVISANDQSYVTYSIRNMTTGDARWYSRSPYTNAARPSDQQITPSTVKGGIVFRAVFPGPDDWHITFTGVSTGWY